MTTTNYGQQIETLAARIRTEKNQAARRAMQREMMALEDALADEVQAEAAEQYGW